MSKEAMRVAVEALSLMYANSTGTTDDEISARLRARSALSLLRAELEAGGEQEPVGYASRAALRNMRLGIHNATIVPKSEAVDDGDDIPLYASPVAADTQGDAKTQQRLMALADRMPVQPWGIGSRREDAIAFARAALEELK